MSLDIDLIINVDTGGEELHRVILYEGNYTHNVIPIWEEVGVYDALYNSDGWNALAIIDTLESGVTKMKENRVELKKLNPKNGWGSWSGALLFLMEFIDACEKHPKAIIEISK